MRRSKKFESATRRIARARLKASPKLWREYLKLRGSWLYRVTFSIVLLNALCVGVFMLLSLPFFAGASLAGSHSVLGASGTIAAALAAAIVLGHAIWLVQELLCSRTLAIASQLPIADDELVSNRLQSALRASLLLLIVSLVFFVGVISGLPLRWQQNVLILGLAVLEWLIGVALMVLIPVYFPRMARRETFGVMTTLGFGALLLSAIGPAFKIVQRKTVAVVLLGALPTGWPLLMLEFGILRNRPIAVLLLLLPTTILVALAVFAVGRLKRHYDVAEISFEDGGVASAVLTRHFETPQQADDEDVSDAEASSWHDDLGRNADAYGLPLNETAPARVGLGPLLRSWFVKAKPEDDDGDECDAEFARARVLSREFLEPFDWPSGGWIESTLGGRLSDREQLVADLLVGGAPNWTQRQTKLLIGGLVAILVLYLVSLWAGRAAMAMASQLCFGLLAHTLTGAWPAAVWRAKTGHVCSIAGALPITTRELLRLTMILGSIRAAFLSPMFYGMAVLGIYGFTGQWEFGRAAYLAAKGVLVFVALHQWAFLSLIPVTDSWRLRRKWSIGLLLAGLMGATIGAGGMLFYVGRNEMKAFIAAAVMLGLGWVAQKWHHRAMTRDPYDFITMPRNDFASQQEAQRERRDRTKSW